MLKLDKIRKSKNVIELFDDLQDGKRELQKITRSVINGFKIDDETGESWRKSIDEALDIAQQVMTKKNFPWEGSANIKYPLITEAAINFAARVFPEIIPNDNIVEMKVIGLDPAGDKYRRSFRVGTCISYQCASSPDWKEHIDRLLHILPVVGTVFTKTYYDELENRNCVDLCPPDQVVLNHDTTTSLVCARRVTHIIKKSVNDVISYQRSGMYNTDIDVEILRPEGCDSEDDDFQIELYEQHCWLDLDDDGYKEPYVVTVHPQSQSILRIVNRIKPGSIKKNSDGEIYKIEAINYFQDYHFIRSPDGGFYSMGFGQLLLPLNKAINSLINQLIDAGTVSVTQGGFLGKGLRLKGGELRFKPFEWKVLDAASGTDLKDNVFPFPVREPSQTLLSLLTMLIDVGKLLTSSTEAMNGNMSGSNVGQGTLNGLIEQGSKVFAAINKRFYDSLTLSFKKLYELNYYYLTDKEYQNIIDDPTGIVKIDFDLASNDVRPVADPQLSSMAQKLSKGTVLLSLRTADPRAVDKYLLETLQYDKEQIEAFLPAPDPQAPPPPETIKTLSEAELNKAKAQEVLSNVQSTAIRLPMEQASLEMDLKMKDSQVQEGATRAWKMLKDAAHGDQKLLIAGTKMTQQEQLKQLQQEHNQLKDSVAALLKNKEIDIKAQDNAMKTAVELKKIEEAKKNDSGTGQK